MNFSLNKSLEILENTPIVISTLLNNLSDDWIFANEGENTWTVKEVIAHLIVCEKTDWLIRAKTILSSSDNKTFLPIDMLAHFELSKNNSLRFLINEFKQLRQNNIKEINNFNINEMDLLKTGIHPIIGEVNLQQLVASWVTHDLTHLAQIFRIMAKQNRENVGAFRTYLKILA